MVLQVIKEFFKGFSTNPNTTEPTEVRRVEVPKETIQEIPPVVVATPVAFWEDEVVSPRSEIWNPRDISELQPVINGWKLLGIIEHVGRSTLIKNAPGEEVPSMYLEKFAWCDQCERNLPRRWTFIVQHIYTNEVKQVGSTCVKKFLEESDLNAV